MIQEVIRRWLKPTIREVYEEGYKDGERRMLDMYRFGWEVGHADTMAALGEIDIQEVDEAIAEEIEKELHPEVFEEVKA